MIQDRELSAQLDEANDVVRLVQAMLPQVRVVAAMLIDALRGGRRLYMVGNGGSALQAQHFVAELVGHYRTDHRPLPAHALAADGGILTALANDYDPLSIFSRQVRAYGGPGDVLVAFSTSGNSNNVLSALREARGIGMLCLGLAGNDGGLMRDACDHGLFIPTRDTARIQEAHLLFVHLLSEYLDEAFPA